MSEFQPGDTKLDASAFKNLDDWGEAGEPTRLGNWILEEQIGTGGWGVVYRGRHKTFQQRVSAIKVLKPALAAQEGNPKRFEQEARALDKLSKLERIVGIEDFDEEDGFCWMQLELMEGYRLNEEKHFSTPGHWLQYVQQQGGEGLPEEVVLQIACDVLEALMGAHREGVIHRDIKPGNLLFDAQRRVKLVDFGIAKVIEESLEGRANTAFQQKTQTGFMLGTPAYMSPEQKEGGKVGVQSDLYSVAVVLFQLLTGDLPEGACEWPSECGVENGEWWDGFLKKGLMKRLNRRWQSAGEMIEALKLIVSREEVEDESPVVGSESREDGPLSEDQPLASNKAHPKQERQRIDSEDRKTSASSFSRESFVRSELEGRFAGEERDFEIAPDVMMKMCWCPATTSEEWKKLSGGKETFTMGSPESEIGRKSNENQHEVMLTRGFWLGKYPVTQKQYLEVMGLNPSRFNVLKKAAWFLTRQKRHLTKDHPVECVAWTDSIDFVTKLIRRTDWYWRLPSESEWEYGCRSGSQSAYFFGDAGEMLENYGWYNENSGSKTHSVGEQGGNAWGLNDVHGNVWEWCGDWYDEFSKHLVKNPWGPSWGIARVTRGGGWGILASSCRSANRYKIPPDLSFNYLGFRVVLSPMAPVMR